MQCLAMTSKSRATNWGFKINSNGKFDRQQLQTQTDISDIDKATAIVEWQYLNDR